MDEAQFTRLVGEIGLMAALEVATMYDKTPLMETTVALPSHIDLVEYIPDTDPDIALLLELGRQYRAL